MTDSRRLEGSLQFPDPKAAEVAHAAMPRGTRVDGDRVVFDVTAGVDEAALETVLASAVTGSVVVTELDGTARKLTALGRSFWQKRWDDGQTGWHEAQPNALLVRHFARLALAPRSRVLVPLAGKAVDVAWIAEQGHEVVGIEISMKGIEAFFAERAAGPSSKTTVGPHPALTAHGVTLVCADVFELDFASLGKFDAVYDRAALVALEPSTRERYVDVCRALQKDDGKTMLVSFVYDATGRFGPPWSIDEVTVRRLFSREDVSVLETRPATISPRLAASGVKSVEESAYLIRRS